MNLSSTTSTYYNLPLNFISNSVFFFKTVLMDALSYIELLLNIQINTNMKDALVMAIKFLLCIALLIFARGGIPRFRFDYLTKLGWIRFFSLVLLSFLVEVLILAMF